MKNLIIGIILIGITSVSAQAQEEGKCLWQGAGACSKEMVEASQRSAAVLRSVEPALVSSQLLKSSLQLPAVDLIAVPEEIAGTTEWTQKAVEVKENRLNNVIWRPLLRATVRAFPMKNTFDNVFTGTVFQTEYEGKKEIYVAVATHALAEVPTSKGESVMSGTRLARTFNMEGYDRYGRLVPMKATVVQLGAVATFDISLARLEPEYEDFFEPLSLGKINSPGEKLYSQGLGGSYTVFVPEREIVENTTFSLRTTMAGLNNFRQGFCGAPVVNGKKELVAIHTGTKNNEFDDGRLLGYSTPASYLDLLVQAYHNGGEVYYPLELNGHQVYNLRVDEFVSRYVLRDSEGKPLRYEDTRLKFAYQHLQRWVARFQPRYIDLTIGNVHWFNDRLIQKTNKVRQVRYDFQTRQTVPLEEEGGNTCR